MNKLLTISVAAYNADIYLEKCINSCINSHLDDIEIIIVNDGSKDSTSKIAKGFSDKYPKSITVIDKENGGYGSTVNTSMRLATGKYFKLLDSDDWFDENGLVALLDLIRDGIDVDLILTDMVKVEGNNHALCKAAKIQPKEKVSHAMCKWNDFEPGMWYSTVKTDLLKRNSFILPEKRLYTDTLFMALSLQNVKTLCYLDIPLYYYLKGITTQSSSIESMVRYFDNYYATYNDILDICTNSDLEKSPGLVQRFKYSYGALIERIFLLPKRKENKQRLQTIDSNLKNRSPFLFESVAKRPGGRTVRLLRKSNYNLYSIIKFFKNLS